MSNKLVRLLVPRRCFVCKKYSGWATNNVDTIKVDCYGEYVNDYHHHEHCLEDAICNPEDYTVEVVEKALKAYRYRKGYEAKIKEDQEELLSQLEQVQTTICGDLS